MGTELARPIVTVVMLRKDCSRYVRCPKHRQRLTERGAPQPIKLGVFLRQQEHQLLGVRPEGPALLSQHAPAGDGRTVSALRPERCQTKDGELRPPAFGRHPIRIHQVEQSLDSFGIIHRGLSLGGIWTSRNSQPARSVPIDEARRRSAGSRVLPRGWVRIRAARACTSSSYDPKIWLTVDGALSRPRRSLAQASRGGQLSPTSRCSPSRQPIPARLTRRLTVDGGCRRRLARSLGDRREPSHG